MTGIFKQKNPANIILLLVFGVLIKIPAFFHPYTPVPDNQDAIFYKELLKLLQPAGKSNPILYPALAVGLLYVQAIMLNSFINRQRMTNIQTYYPGMSYLLLTSLLPEWNYFSAPLIINTFLLFILSAIFRTYNQQDARGAIFNVGLTLGIGSFIFLPSLSFIVWVILALAIMRPFRLAEWLLCLVGAATPYYFNGVYLFLTDQWSWAGFWSPVQLALPSILPTLWLAGSAFLLVMPFLFGGYYVQENLRKMLIQVRKGWSLLLLYLFAGFLVFFINTASGLENWVLLAVPFAAFHASMYLYASFRIVPQLFFWLSVGFILIYQYGGPGW
ncbi:MAG TPA: hypothetical protein VFV31_02510 [Chitinophagaceae bacterium]|nr:hypothetical protein [Chitinophagaceae bacterium]